MLLVANVAAPLAAVSLTSLWLPIALSSVAVFVLASLMWMVVGHHKKDWIKLPNEDAVMTALRGQCPEGGQYVFPVCDDPKEMCKPEFQAKYAQGPAGYLFVRKPAPFTMTPMLVQSMLFYLVVSTLVAWLATMALRDGVARGEVFHVVGLATWLAYAAGQIWQVIWIGTSWGHTLRCMFDCLLYAAATGGIFAWRWPAGRGRVRRAAPRPA
ncbi:MAG: hypothetical protein EXS13_03965 [Planctomycetes bacterium]|nr:hypothetical protein [Planctomycetota bacterium]